jgi:hypothetical protein
MAENSLYQVVYGTYNGIILYDNDRDILKVMTPFGGMVIMNGMSVWREHHYHLEQWANQVLASMNHPPHKSYQTADQVGKQLELDLNV